MKFSMKIMIGIMFSPIICLAQLYQPGQPKPPGKYYVQADLRTGANSLDGLIKMADLILDGTVGKVFSIRRNPDIPTSLSTYSSISVNSVIRGKLPEGQQSVFMIETGGILDGYEVYYSNSPFVKSGERYVLFLKSDPKLEPVQALGAPVYRIVGSWVGKAKVTEEKRIKFYSADAHSSLHSFDDLNVEEFVNGVFERINYLYPKPPKELPVHVGPPPPDLHLPPVGRPSL
jgi:hypothetical protein